jgi:hypothetical protein
LERQQRDDGRDYRDIGEKRGRETGAGVRIRGGTRKRNFDAVDGDDMAGEGFGQAGRASWSPVGG